MAASGAAQGTPQLHYALVARDKTVLAEHTDQSGNFPTVTRVILGKIDTSSSGRVSYVYDSFMFHYTCNDNLIFLCMTDVSKGGDRVRLPYAFLEDVKAEFNSMYGDRSQNAIAFEMNGEYGPLLEKKMKQYNEGSMLGGGDQIGAVQSKLDAVKGVMVQNIESILERGEKLELLVDKTDQLQTTAFQFNKSSRKLRNHMWWRKVKCYGAVAFSVLLIIWLITVWACNIDYSKCGNDGKKKNH